MKKIIFAVFSLFLYMHLTCDSLWVPPLLSAIIPGGGQFYNREYIKSGIFAAAEITVIALYYNEYKKNGSRESLYRDISIGIILFSVLDAYISGELKESIIMGEKSDTLKTK